MNETLWLTCFLNLYRLGCLYLAGKVEHTYIKLCDLLKIYDKCSEQDILDHEIIVLEASCHPMIFMCNTYYC